MSQFTWIFDVNSIQCVEGNIIRTIRCLYQLKDGDISVNMPVVVDLPAPAEGQEVLPYDQLIKATVAGWVEDVLGDATLTHYQDYLRGLLERAKQPPEIVTPPWMSEDAPAN